MKLTDLEIYNLSMDFADVVWEIVMKWDNFPKNTIGNQWVRAADSVAANISEGFGRNSYKDSRNFYFFARGSLYESKTWLEKSYKRKLVTEAEYQQLFAEHNKIGVKLNNFIKAQTNLINKVT